MIYKILGVGSNQFIKLVRLGRIPGVKMGEAVDVYDTIEVTMGRRLAIEEPSIRHEAATLLTHWGIPANADGLPTYTADPAIVSLIDPEDAELERSTRVEIDESKYPASLVCHLLAYGISENNLKSGWELDRESSAKRASFDRNIEWPIKVSPHGQKCNCLACTAIRELLLEQEEMQGRKSYRWTGHIRSDDPSSPTMFNAHTHSIANHLDFQIVLPMPNEIAHQIFEHLFQQIKAGISYKRGDIAEEIPDIKMAYIAISEDGEPEIRVIDAHWNLTFINAVEDGRPVLRIIIPDPEGNLKKEDMIEDPPCFRDQYTVIR